MFYEFSQNNSGGAFDFDKKRGISTRVFIEADSAREANYRAEIIGLYFDGVSKGVDCGCCGDRWYQCMYDSEGLAKPKAYGYSIHAGDPIPTEPAGKVGKADWTFAPFKWLKDGKPEVFIHYKDGSIVAAWA